MSHQFYEGSVYHKRFTPKVHEFTYPFFLLDIDLSMLYRLKNRLFAFEGINLFSFKSKDHFGDSEDFMQNVNELIEKFGFVRTTDMHFITLPRVVNFVFNPISVLILTEYGKPTHLLVEVHNYNGGRIVYPVVLNTKDEKNYRGSIPKDMYVSPFLETCGEYRFLFRQEEEKITLKVDLYEDRKKKLTASFSGSSRPFESKTVAKLFVKHTFLTFWVVTRTLWQSLKLKAKGLTFYSPMPSDQIRRY
jgi:DUF1365 family protein